MPDIGLLQGASPRPRTSLDVEKAEDTSQPMLMAAHASVASPPFAEIESEKLDAKIAASQIVVATKVQALVKERAPPAGSPHAPAVRVFDPVAIPQPWRARDLFWLLLGLVVIVGTGLGIRDPWPADEPRFAALARDMALSGEWLFPRVGGDLYQDKPPLYFWLLAISYTLVGSVRWSFLIPSFIAAGGVLLLVYDYGRRIASNNAALAAALLVLTTIQFVLATRGAQIDATLCFLTTLSLYGFLRHFLLGPSWRWYALGGFAAGLGVFTKGVGFLPILTLIPFFLLRGFGWRGLAPIGATAGKGGWRWWLAPLTMLLAVSLWFVPMVLAASAGSPEYAAYRDEILFKQTVDRYAAAWHHVKGWYYFLVEVIPPLWVPWSLLLIWLVPRWKGAWTERDARVWLPLGWVLLVLLFFSLSPGKRGIYIMPALPALAFAALPFLDEVLSKTSVRRVGYALSALFMMAAGVLAIGYSAKADFARDIVASAGLKSALPLYIFVALCGWGLSLATRRAPLAAWPVTLAALAIVFSYGIAPAMNPTRSGSAFVREVLDQVAPHETLGLVAYKEQFLLYLDRPTVNFGHRRIHEEAQESFDAARWLAAAPNRVLLIPDDLLSPCFGTAAHIEVGKSSRDHWFLVRGTPAAECAAKGLASQAIEYAVTSRSF